MGIWPSRIVGVGEGCVGKGTICLYMRLRQSGQVVGVGEECVG